MLLCHLWAGQSMSATRSFQIVELCQTVAFLPVSQDDVIDDERTFQTKLEDLAKRPGSSNALDQPLANHLLGRLRCVSQQCKGEEEMAPLGMSGAILCRKKESILVQGGCLQFGCNVRTHLVPWWTLWRCSWGGVVRRIDERTKARAFCKLFCGLVALLKDSWNSKPRLRPRSLQISIKIEEIRQNLWRVLSSTLQNGLRPIKNETLRDTHIEMMLKQCSEFRTQLSWHVYDFQIYQPLPQVSNEREHTSEFLNWTCM